VTCNNLRFKKGEIDCACWDVAVVLVVVLLLVAVEADKDDDV